MLFLKENTPASYRSFFSSKKILRGNMLFELPSEAKLFTTIWTKMTTLYKLKPKIT